MKTKSVIKTVTVEVTEKRTVNRTFPIWTNFVDGDSNQTVRYNKEKRQFEFCWGPYLYADAEGWEPMEYGVFLDGVENSDLTNAGIRDTLFNLLKLHDLTMDPTRKK